MTPLDSFEKSITHDSLQRISRDNSQGKITRQRYRDKRKFTNVSTVKTPEKVKEVDDADNISR